MLAMNQLHRVDCMEAMRDSGGRSCAMRGCTT